ncbi:aminodeoxychorismate synthase component I [Endozoicomonas sp. Mp262]|uniref:aminodeoxychorismate synthase component I n=1 Tax=Endozoicomonas sp. Mp262 TaxID=2919499 RepID=UPI0021DA07E5
MKKLDLHQLDYREDSSQYFEYFRHMPLASYLDSCAMAHDSENGRFDIITAEPSDVITVTAEGEVVWDSRLAGGDEKRRYSANPFDILSELFETLPPVANDDLPFTGGLLGFWAYELGTVLEPEKIKKRADNNSPLMCVGLFWWALVTDHQQKKTTLVFHPDIDQKTYTTIINALKIPVEPCAEAFSLEEKFSASINYDQYQQAFSRIQDYIVAGDCYEVNLTQEFTAPYSGNSWLAYQHLRQVSPAPYSAYLAYPGLSILSHSPERFIRVTDRHVETFPIKGTIARGATPEEDITNANVLQNSEKDKSENLMIVDLLRNDLGKVCQTGSIKVPRLFALESYANVHHLVSSVTGTLSPETCVFELMASVFPGGSITGAPKIRSMEIIRELEPGARSVYCGSIGYISCNGRLDTNIAIRSLVDNGDRLHCWGGGAIVAESDCQLEYQESVTKVSNLMQALEQMGSRECVE